MQKRIAKQRKEYYNLGGKPMAHEFEWDEQKEQINIKKHGIAFRTATAVFDDPFMVDLYDEAHSTVDEARYKAIGRAGNTLTVLSVIYTERQKIRIISARLATPREEEEYYYDSNL